MTTKLHELLAVEKTLSAAANKLLTETIAKFKKYEFFQGHTKTLRMIEESPQNSAIEMAAAESRQLPTTVVETLKYTLKFWADAEDVIYQKNRTNQIAASDLMFGDIVIAKLVPVDELLGLESRLETLRKLMDEMPTLNAGTNWLPDYHSNKAGTWVAGQAETTTKTEKTTIPVVLYPATDKHPAQVKESSTDKIVGTFTLLKYCGAATSAQKAEAISVIDTLIMEVKKARMRANNVEADQSKIGSMITDLIMDVFKKE